jgi:hypothetical protein
VKLTGSELRTVIDELQSAWQAHGDADSLYQPAARRDQRFTGEDAARVAIVHGWARHLHETARAAALLLDNRMTNAALPLVRQMFECALTAVWVVQSKDQHGVRAIIREHSRSRRAFAIDAHKAASPTFRESADDIADSELAHDLATSDSSRQFRDICLDLSPGGVDAYIYYRVMSSYSHASLAVTDLYYKAADPGSGAMPYRLAEPRAAIPADTLLYFVAVTLVWGARAYTYTSRDHTHRSVIRRAAHTLQVNSEIQLSDHYRRRHAKPRTTR